MTVGILLELVDELAPNQFSWNNKVRWLSELDGKVLKDLAWLRGLPLEMDGVWTETEGQEPTLTATEPIYNWRATNATQRAEEQGKELLIQVPWAADIYLNYLCMQMDLANREWEGYELHRDLFYRKYREYYDFRVLELTGGKANGSGRRWRF